MEQETRTNIKPFPATSSLDKRPVDTDLLTGDLGAVQVVNRCLSFFERVVLNECIALSHAVNPL